MCHAISLSTNIRYLSAVIYFFTWEITLKEFLVQDLFGFKKRNIFFARRLFILNFAFVVQIICVYLKNAFFCLAYKLSIMTINKKLSPLSLTNFGSIYKVFLRIV